MSRKLDTTATRDTLAIAIGVHPRTITTWRGAGAPQSLDPAAWVEWLQSTKRHAPARSLADAAGIALPPEPVRATSGDDDIDWKREKDRESALIARLKRQHLEGTLLPRDRAVSGMAEIARTFLVQVEQDLWARLSTSLSSAPAPVVSAARTAMAAAVVEIKAKCAPKIEAMCEKTFAVDPSKP